MSLWFCCFFFSSRRRHTRLQGDWSSDVCSSDLFLTTCACAQRGQVSVCIPDFNRFCSRCHYLFNTLINTMVLHGFPGWRQNGRASTGGGRGVDRFKETLQPLLVQNIVRPHAAAQVEAER